MEILFMLPVDLSKGITEAREKKVKRLAVQVPEGLKQGLPGIAAELGEKTGAQVFSFVGMCFGACDLKDREAKELGAQLLIHLGHTKFIAKTAIETVYIPLEYKAEEKKVVVLAGKLAAELKKKKFKKVGLCSTIQFEKHREILGRELGKKGFKAFTGKGKGVEKGQVLGCNYSTVKSIEEKVEAVAFVGDGLFHPIGLSFAVNKPVLLVDPLQGEVNELGSQKDLFLRKRIAMIEKVKQAKSIAIWVSTKTGQQRMELAMQLKKKFEEKGKKAFVFASDLLRAEYIMGIGIDAIVSTACPRIALDDSSLFRQAIVNPAEARIALGEKKLEKYEFEGLC